MHGDVVYAQTWEVFTLKNTIELPFAAKHRAESFDFCLLILFLEDSAVFPLYLQTVVPVVPIYFYALVAVLQLVSTIHTNILIQQVQWCLPLLLLITWTLYRYSN